MSSFIKALQAHLQDTPDKIPPGWKTLDQIAAEADRSPHTVRLWASRLVAKGVMEKRQFRVPDSLGRVLPRTLFKLKS